MRGGDVEEAVVHAGAGGRRVGHFVEGGAVREVGAADVNFERAIGVADAGGDVGGVGGDVEGGVDPTLRLHGGDEVHGVAGIGGGGLDDEGELFDDAGVEEGVVGDGEHPRGAGGFAGEVAQSPGTIGEEDGRIAELITEVALLAVVVNHVVGREWIS